MRVAAFQPKNFSINKHSWSKLRGSFHSQSKSSERVINHIPVYRCQSSLNKSIETSLVPQTFSLMKLLHRCKRSNSEIIGTNNIIKNNLTKAKNMKEMKNDKNFNVEYNNESRQAYKTSLSLVKEKSDQSYSEISNKGLDIDFSTVDNSNKQKNRKI